MQRGMPAHRTFVIPRRWTTAVGSQFRSRPRNRRTLAAVYARRLRNSSTPSLVSIRHHTLAQESVRAGKNNVWSLLTLAWAAYYFAVLTFGRYPQYERLVVWVGGATMGMLTLMAFLGRPSGIPTEALTLLALLLWTLTGTISVMDWASFLKFFKLLAEMVFVVAAVGLVLRHSGKMRFFYSAFLAVAVFNVLFGVQRISVGQLSPDEFVRDAGLTGNANALGFFSFMGVLGAMALWGEMRIAWFLKAVVLSGATLSFYGVLVSGSMGAFLVLPLALVLWAGMCYRGSSPRAWKVLLTSSMVVIMTFCVSWYVIEHTHVGDRMRRAATGNESSAAGRMSLSIVGLRLFAQNPLTGVGLGQFRVASQTGANYTHNEWTELLATTGLVGLVIYLLTYVLAWMRLTRSIRLTRDPQVRYYGNLARMILIILVVSGMIFRPNFLSFDTVFLLAVAVGTGQWAERRTHFVRRGIRRYPAEVGIPLSSH